MRVAREIEEWWGVARWLFIPESKQKEIRQTFADEIEKKKQSICIWIDTDPLASWRRLIWALDSMRQYHLADSIRPNAEPLAGSHQFYITLFYMHCGMQIVLMTVFLTC